MNDDSNTTSLSAENPNITEEEVDYEAIMAFYNETVAFERKIGIIIPSIFAFIIILGVFGNLLVVLVALNRQMRNSTNTLIIGLAVSDLMFLLLCVPYTAIDYAVQIWIFPEWICSMINFCQHTSVYCSVWTLTLMALDRYLAVVYPVESISLRTPRNTFIIMVILYAIIFASQVPVGLMHGVYTYPFVMEERSVCAIVSIAKGELSAAEARVYFMTFNLFGYVLPLGISIVLYWRMLRRLWHMPRPGGHSLTPSLNSSIRSKPEARKAKRKVTRLVSTVLFIWAICWLPLNICFFLSGLAYPDTLVMNYGVTMVIVQISSQVLAYMNSCLNPILYALMSENFRKGFIRVLRTICYKVSCGTCCNSDDKVSLRLELTNCNNASIKRTNSQSLNAKSGEKAALLSESITHSQFRSSVRVATRSTSVRSFNL